MGRARAERGLGQVLLALFFVAQLLSVAHRSLETHAVCPEHGELVHVEHGLQVGVGGEHAPGSEAPAGEQLRKISAGDGAHAEHCAFDLCSPERVGKRQVASNGVVVPAGSQLQSCNPGDERHVAVPILLQAPKQSPPRA